MAAASSAAPPPSPFAGLWSGWVVPKKNDPRWPFAGLLTLYCVLGFLFFGFNRTPAQMFFIMGSGALLDVTLTWFSRREKVVPLSAWISCASLAILLNYSKHSLVLFLPVLLAIGSKHVLTFEGKHVFNPSMFGVATSLLVGHEVITAAPAYQWAGSSLTVTFFLVTAAASLFVWRIGRGWLIGSFLVFYALNTAVRAWVMRHHLPPEMLFIGTMTTPPFYLFTLYMITDPATSPKRPALQVLVAFLIAAVDLVLHLKESVYTFFYAALIVATGRYLLVHARKIAREGAWRTLASELSATRLRGIFGVLVVAASYFALVMALQTTLTRPAGFTMKKLDVTAAGLGTEMSDILHQVDPRVQHVGKWLLSVGDAVAAGDVDNDGDVDLFLTNPMKRPEDRAALYLNDLVNKHGPSQPFHFTRVPLPALDERVRDPKKFGLPAGGTLVDWDGDGDLDLCVTWGFGKTRMLKSNLTETGSLSFEDVSEAIGVDEHTVSLAAVFFDVENDGDLDLFLLNATSPVLKDYTPPRPLNVFDLPAPEYTGDRRMFHFMHDGWHDANNGGGQTLFINDGAGRFQKQDGARWGLTSTRWSLIATPVDFNHDGFTDVYVANDFGPDELLLNEGGTHFRSIHGSMFNDVGNDTYKGMNATQADFDRNGFLDVTVSNVHHSLQAEGSMLWMVRPNPDDAFVPLFSDEATQRGALNEHRFAWGAQAGDLDNDGWPDLVQANGMLDDRLDRSIPDGERKDYWYVNHKLMQSGPEIHTYADMWGDLRGRTIYPNEARRAYLNLGDAAPGHFVDVAEQIGIADPDNSRGVLLSDLDNDGDLDLVVTNQHGPVSLYKSELREGGSRAHFIDVDVRGGARNTHGVGAVVHVSWTDSAGARQSLVQEQHLLGGFASQHDPRLHFGLGDHGGPVDVEVRWPGGVTASMTVEPDRLYVVKPEPLAEARDGG
jgi:hypothetical protein